MRALTDVELQAATRDLHGAQPADDGGGNTVVVTGHPTSGWSTWALSSWPGNVPQSAGAMGDPYGTGAPYTGPTVSMTPHQASASAYASKHISSDLDLNDPHSLMIYTTERENLQHTYMQALDNPNAPVSEAFGASVTGTQLQSFLDRYTITLTNTPASSDPLAATTNPDGTTRYAPAYSQPNYVANTYSTVVHTDAADFDQYAAKLGSLGLAINYEEFHEAGHMMPDALAYDISIYTHDQVANGQLVVTPAEQVQIEQYANTAGAGLAAFTQTPYPTDAQLGDFFGVAPR